MLNAKYDASTHPEKDPNKSLSQMNVCCLFLSERERGRERSDLFCKDFCSDNYIRSICSLQKPVNVVVVVVVVVVFVYVVAVTVVVFVYVLVYLRRRRRRLQSLISKGLFSFVACLGIPFSLTSPILSSLSLSS